MKIYDQISLKTLEKVKKVKPKKSYSSLKWVSNRHPNDKYRSKWWVSNRHLAPKRGAGKIQKKYNILN